VHAEVAVEPGDLERTPRLEAGCGQEERLTLVHAGSSLDEDSERGRVEELHLTEIDDQPRRLFEGAGDERLAELVGVVEVELSGEVHDHSAVAAIDARHRVDPTPTVALHCVGFNHQCGSYAVRMEVAEVAARAVGENFPVGSVLFPRRLRPHIRALYCYARLVDELGDAYDGDRLEALDELEREVDLVYTGRPVWPVLRNVQPTVREFDLPREPFLRLIEANRMDQRVSTYETWDDLKWYCVHSADPCGRLVLGVLRRLDDPECVAASDSVCTGLQLVNFLQDVPRDLELGRVYLPAEDLRHFGDPALDRPSPELRELLRFEAARAVGLLTAADVLRARIGGRLGRAVALFGRGGLAALDSLESAGWDLFTRRPRPSRARLAREAALALVR
jgi:squalene synthase HpnC